MEPSATPPSGAAPTRSADVTTRMDENRLRAKAIRQAREAELSNSGNRSSPPKTSTGIMESENVRITAAGAGRKRPFSSISASEKSPAAPAVPASNRDGRVQSQDGPLKAAKNFAKFVDYNMSSMTNTKGGFITTEDDPFNSALKSGTSDPTRPKHMTAKEWDRLQTLRRLKRNKAGPFEPGLSVLEDEAARKKCRECGGLEIDFVWEEVFGCCVCAACKDKFPEKYSLLTKTECKEDYLLTDPELRDEELLPHLNKPNPHKSHWHDMMLFLRYQVEEYAVQKKWGSAEALDAEFERREEQKKKRKEAKFKEKLLDLKKKTRTEAFRRQQSGAKGPTKFGDTIAGGKHVHNWGTAVQNEDGMTVRKCLECDMEVEEMEF
ncbi:related to DNA repair protein RAD14 [Cephalotrichum gorgonifer]|uniref:DNA repair protein RAD14 n=1 Tax=Cephalotrichum gorgonifer TaxID=2041049 RepID=A0AAE8N1T9_9PEZI|nr:related to DNA repair protein RAD14 [Cephalotrichum gorgonifer]